MPSIARHYQIRQDMNGPVGRTCFYSGDPIARPDQVNPFVPHPKLKASESLRAIGEKIQEIPLRHQRDKLAARGQMAEVGGPKGEVANAAVRRSELLVRQLEEVVQQPQLMHDLERGRMHGVAAKIPKEVPVFLKNHDVYASPRDQVSQHHARRAATHNTTGSSK